MHRRIPVALEQKRREPGALSGNSGTGRTKVQLLDFTISIL
jgi:hypothetical protein